MNAESTYAFNGRKYFLGTPLGVESVFSIHEPQALIFVLVFFFRSVLIDEGF